MRKEEMQSPQFEIDVRALKLKTSEQQMLQKVVATYYSRFGEAPMSVVRAPGRVNVIGEHTDYNAGFVLPVAIDRATWIALSPSGNDAVELYSMDHDEVLSFNSQNPSKGGASWGEYPKSTAWSLLDAGFALKGWRGVTACDVPIGAGLSSSASFELAVARAFVLVSGCDWNGRRMSELCQRAENEWVGVRCGIMDQMISAVGQAGMALLIDCRDLSFEAVPVPQGVSLLVMDTSTRRGLMDTAYNERHAQCNRAADYFGVPTLRDVTLNQVMRQPEGLDSVTWRRAKHVVTECARTLEAAEAMRAGDAVGLGTLMNASHDSLRDEFEVTNEELNIITEIARQMPRCLGARMTGAGFGGCAVALMAQEEAHACIPLIQEQYMAKTGLSASLYVCHASNGAEVVY